jgi:hypothetical protein
MSEDDRTVVNEAIVDGGTYRILPDEEVTRWKERVAGISDDFLSAHSSLADELLRKGLITKR